VRVVIYSEPAGVFLGSCMGLGWWSEMDPAGQDSAITFESEEVARAEVARWKHGPEEPWRCVPVEASADPYATVEDCVRAGLPRWIP